MSSLLGAWGYWENFKKTSENSKSAWNLIVLVLVLFIVNWLVLSQQLESIKKENYSKDFGKFDFRTSTTTPPTLHLGLINAKEYILGDDKWSAWSENGKLNLQAVVRDQNRDKIFYIDGTDWKNLDGKEFNYDEQGMEVKNSKGNVIFQLEFNKEENSIYVYGFLFQGPDQVILAGRDNTKIYARQMPTEEDVDWLISSLKPMFRYPRETHLGERVSK